VSAETQDIPETPTDEGNKEINIEDHTSNRNHLHPPLKPGE
jgi:hypothetical protein